MQHTEIWKDMEEDPHYQISNFGRIKMLSHSYTRLGIPIVLEEKIKTPINNKISIKAHPYDIRTLLFKYFPTEYIEKFLRETTLENEIWKDIPGFEGYQISSLGRARSLPRMMDSSTSINRIRRSKQESFDLCKNISLGRILTPVKIGNPDRNGLYRLAYGLMKDSKRYQFQVSRLVAEIFIPNPDNLPEVNHKNRDIHNNSVDNLEWVTKEDNINHAQLKRETLVPLYDLAYQEGLSPDDMLTKLIDYYKIT